MGEYMVLASIADPDSYNISPPPRKSRTELLQLNSLYPPCCPFVFFSFVFGRAQESHMCAVLVSEENEEPIIIENKKSGDWRAFIEH